MKTKLQFGRGQVRLVSSDSAINSLDLPVLAAMTLYDGAGRWTVEDVRLTQSHEINRYWYGNSGSLCSYYRPATAAAEQVAKQLLREYQERADGTLIWCTFDGIVRGKPELNGGRPGLLAGLGGYFSRREGLAKLAEIQTFWRGYEGSLEQFPRLDNPLRQPRESEVVLAVFQHLRLNAAAKATALTVEVGQNMIRKP